eukprot:TRINITY_DN3983_c1_g1_i2.p1 TRINITY_DN3983_c1_g1~~TRINITY_DN3983_c1_g1_i2.p1  ORF type:complete len:370 (+),score=79.62 TRINITY_DN3983_c1_g1_i2:116-1225(+)
MAFTNGMWFGVPLAAVLNRSGEKEVPSIVKRLTWALASPHHVAVEGLFEKKARANNVQAKKYSIDCGEDWGFDRETDPHMLSALLKLYLRELPEPILTFDLYPSFITAAQIKDWNEKEARLMEIFEEVPGVNVDLFNYMCNFFAAVLQHSAYNGVTSSRLVEAFYPAFIRPRVETVESMQEFPHVLAVFKVILDIYIKGSIQGSTIFRRGTDVFPAFPNNNSNTLSMSTSPSSHKTQQQQPNTTTTTTTTNTVPTNNRQAPVAPSRPSRVTMLLNDAAASQGSSNQGNNSGNTTPTATSPQSGSSVRHSMTTGQGKHSVDQVKRVVHEAIKAMHASLNEMAIRTDACDTSEALVDIARRVRTAQKVLTE